MKNNYEALMNSKELEPILADWSKPIAKGTLIGFKGLGAEGGITAAYPVWLVKDYEIQFVLYLNKKSGKPVLDNTWFNSPNLFINKEPIIVDIEGNNPTTFGDEISAAFNP